MELGGLGVCERHCTTFSPSQRCRVFNIAIDIGTITSSEQHIVHAGDARWDVDCRQAGTHVNSTKFKAGDTLRYGQRECALELCKGKCAERHDAIWNDRIETTCNQLVRSRLDNSIAVITTIIFSVIGIHRD